MNERFCYVKRNGSGGDGPFLTFRGPYDDESKAEMRDLCEEYVTLGSDITDEDDWVVCLYWTYQEGGTFIEDVDNEPINHAMIGVYGKRYFEQNGKALIAAANRLVREDTFFAMHDQKKTKSHARKLEKEFQDDKSLLFGDSGYSYIPNGYFSTNQCVHYDLVTRGIDFEFDDD